MYNYNILFFHGKGSNPETSHTAQSVKRYFDNINIPCFVPDYKPDDRPLDEIEAFIHDYIDVHGLLGNDLVIMGISRGGYWALRTANKIGVVDCIMLNPALNTYNEENDMMPRTINRIDMPLYVYLNDDDELLDSNITYEKLKDKGEVIRYPNGGHRMSNIDAVLDNIALKLQNKTPMI